MGRELPILFNTDMVLAILDGRKKVTRRICRDGNDYSVPDMQFYDAKKRTYAVHSYADKEHRESVSLAETACPVCPDDILYVRETWCKNVNSEEYYYAANRKNGANAPYGLKWRPSIHMPKAAARIWLKVTDVRVERLQDITEEQAVKEGLFRVKYDADTGKEMSAALDWFPIIWDSTVKKTALQLYGWDANPWVWVIEFERCENPAEKGVIV